MKSIKPVLLALGLLAGVLLTSTIRAADVPLELKAGPLSGGTGRTASSAHAEGLLELLHKSPSRDWDAWGQALKRVAEAELDAPRPRGPRETQIYAKAAPAVVLIFSLDRAGNPQGLGSGSVITSEGMVLTCWHVVEGATQLRAVFRPKGEGNPESYPLRIVAQDPTRDLALLRLTERPVDLATLQLGKLSSLAIGADVHAIGHPHGEAWSYTKGPVSNISSPFEWGDGRTKHKADTVIMTQAPLNPGNSGGPLLDDDVQIVGVNAFLARDANSMNFAVSVDDVRRLIAASTQTQTSRTPPTQPDAAPGQRAEKGSCQPRYGQRARHAKLPAWVTPADVNCSGNVNAWLIEWDTGMGKGLWACYDRKGRGAPDVCFHDDNRDGIYEFAEYDSDADGRFDTRAYLDPSGQPVRFERI